MNEIKNPTIENKLNENKVNENKPNENKLNENKVNDNKIIENKFIDNNTVYSKTDIAFALVMLVCGFLYWNLIRLPYLGIGVTLFACVLCLCTAAYLKAGGIRPTMPSLLSLGVVILSALVFVLFDNTPLKLLNFLFLSAVFIYYVGRTTGRTLDKRISAYILGDCCQLVFVVPFSNLACCFKAIKTLFVANKHGKSLLAGALGILIILPVLALVISLLIEADAAFAGLMANLQFNFSLDILFQIILGIPVACYLFGLIYGSRSGRNTEHVTTRQVDQAAAAARFAPAVTVYAALTALNLVYLIFFLSQLSYLFSAFNNQLPAMMTYAEYARRGFFELCAVAGINLVTMTLAHLIVQRERLKILRLETTVLCLFTMLLITTALSKMVMYINSYGLTQLRVYTTWFMILLFFLFAVIVVRQFKTFNAARLMVAGFVILFLVLSFGNVDGRIAAYNIDRYQKGSLETLDVDALARLSDGAVPPMYDLYRSTDDAALKTKLRAAILKTEIPEPMIVPQKTFRDFNFQSNRASKIRNAI